MTPSYRFGFKKEQFQATVAHGGNGEILTMRLPRSAVARGANFVDLTIVPPGASIGVHTHANDNSEIYLIVSGSALMVVNGEEFRVGPGDLVVNPPGGTHGLQNNTAEEVRIAVIELVAEPRQIGNEDG